MSKTKIFVHFMVLKTVTATAANDFVFSFCFFFVNVCFFSIYFIPLFIVFSQYVVVVFSSSTNYYECDLFRYKDKRMSILFTLTRYRVVFCFIFLEFKYVIFIFFD